MAGYRVGVWPHPCCTDPLGSLPQTRELLDQLFHIPLAAALPYPEAPYRPTPTAFSHRPKPTTIGVDVGFEEDRTLGFYHRKPDTLHKFLENDRKVRHAHTHTHTHRQRPAALHCGRGQTRTRYRADPV